jgi:hypothetical protein
LLKCCTKKIAGLQNPARGAKDPEAIGVPVSIRRAEVGSAQAKKRGTVGSSARPSKSQLTTILD